MSEKDKLRAADSDPALEWAKLWQTMAESSNRMFEAWSGSMAPFMLARLSEKPAGFGDGNELSAAIEKMAQGPRLADVWDIDRKLALVFSAWIEMRQRLASYNAVASAPWTRRQSGFSTRCPRPERAERRLRTGARLLPSGAKSPTRNSSATSAPMAFFRRKKSCFRPDCSCEAGRMMSRRPPQPCSACRRARISTM